MESRKRKLPARAARSGEALNKKRKSTPPEPRAQPTSPPPQVVEEILPTSVVAGRALPTVDEPQLDNLSNAEYKSIPESGVLAESLQRSRQKWLIQGVFEKYYTKPTQKTKAQLEAAGNPAKDTMTRLGTCSITVEPHIFDATMFAIKETKQSQSLASVQQSAQRPIIQYGPLDGVVPPPQPVQATPVQSKREPGNQAVNTPLGASGSPSSGITNGAPVVDDNGQTNGHPPGAVNTPQKSPAATTRNADPVIQMLAEKAASNPELKQLMRIVANGEASPDELKKFQTHIDELSRMLKSRPPPIQQPTPPAQQTPQPVQVSTPVNSLVNGQQTPAPKTVSTPKSTPAQPQALRSKGPVQQKSDISGIVFEFAGGNGDRFFFPKYSILEYLPGGQVIASFLIVRKGSSSDATTYNPQIDYYQPVTIRLYTHQGRQLDSLQKVVAPPDEVRRYMDDIMDNTTRAEYVLLAMQLPREMKEISAAEPEKEQQQQQQQVQQQSNGDAQVLWRASKPTPPIVAPKPRERLLTEEEKYQSFIHTVVAT